MQDPKLLLEMLCRAGVATAAARREAQTPQDPSVSTKQPPSLDLPQLLHYHLEGKFVIRHLLAETSVEILQPN